MARQFVSFDWALKKLLRSKANFGILEGFLSELLHEDIKIQSILESESNKHNDLDKANRVDLLVRNQKEELIIIEVQYDCQATYLQRILYGTSKVIAENIAAGDGYDGVKKVISVNIVYFDLGQGEDYIYHGTTKFIGLHKHDELKLHANQKQLYGTDDLYKVFPEYYILKINQFNDIAKDGIDQWIYFLKNDRIDKSFTAKGLKEAADKLTLMKLPPEQQKAHERYYDDLRQQTDMIVSNYKIGKFDGIKEGEKIGLKKGLEQGLEKGKFEEKIVIARKMIDQGITIDLIAKISGLTIEQIEKL